MKTKILLLSLAAAAALACSPGVQEIQPQDLFLQPVLEVIGREVPWMEGKVTVPYLELPDNGKTATHTNMKPLTGTDCTSVQQVFPLPAWPSTIT